MDSLVDWGTIRYSQSADCRLLSKTCCLPYGEVPAAPDDVVFLFLNEGLDKLIFSGRDDFCEVPSQLLTISSSIAPLQRWKVDDAVARLSRPTTGTWSPGRGEGGGLAYESVGDATNFFAGMMNEI